MLHSLSPWGSVKYYRLLYRSPVHPYFMNVLSNEQRLELNDIREEKSFELKLRFTSC